MIGNLIKVIAIAATVAASVPAMANDIKIGFVSLDRILREAGPSVRATKKLEKEFQGRDAEVQKLGKQAKDLQTLLEKESVTMSETDRRNKEADLARITRDLQRVQRELREDFNLRRNEEFSQVIDQANKVVQQIAESEKFDLILQEGVVYRSARIDITDKVLKALAAADAGGGAATPPPSAPKDPKKP